MKLPLSPKVKGILGTALIVVGVLIVVKKFGSKIPVIGPLLA